MPNSSSSSSVSSEEKKKRQRASGIKYFKPVTILYTHTPQQLLKPIWYPESNVLYQFQSSKDDKSLWESIQYTLTYVTRPRKINLNGEEYKLIDGVCKGVKSCTECNYTTNLRHLSQKTCPNHSDKTLIHIKCNARIYYYTGENTQLLFTKNNHSHENPASFKVSSQEKNGCM